MGGPPPSTPLATAFAAGLPSGAQAPEGDLEATLHAFHDAGRAAWPTLAVEAEVLCRWLAERAAPPDAHVPEAALAADAYLACACVADVPGALLAFDRAFAPTIAHVAARLDRSPAFADDAAQAVREKLFVSPPGAPAKIAEYSCRAPLQSWVRVVATRAALNLRRGKAAAEHDPLDALDGRAISGAGADPELCLARARHKAALEGAVRAAVTRLSGKDRTLLRLHLVEGRGVDGLGAHYQVGRSTAARWLAAARDALRELTREELEKRIGPADLRSVAGFVRSQLELSVQGLLGAAGE